MPHNQTCQECGKPATQATYPLIVYYTAKLHLDGEIDYDSASEHTIDGDAGDTIYHCDDHE